MRSLVSHRHPAKAMRKPNIKHLKHYEDSTRTLCGLKIFSWNLKGQRIFLTFTIQNKDEYDVCIKCDKIRTKINAQNCRHR